MARKLRTAINLTALAVSILAPLARVPGDQAVAATQATQTTPAAVCVGVTDCRLVATADVTGDGHADQVGWRQLNADHVQIRVRTAAGTVLTKTVDVTMWWGGGAWGGVAAVDPRPGGEILVGSEQGAHTPMYTMLTDRDGALVVEPSPSPLSPLWQVDAAYGDDMGWWRHTLADGRIAMTQKIAVRTGHGNEFAGHDVTYVWDGSAWKRSTSVTVHYSGARTAGLIAGFHVPGLARFPGLS